MTVERRRLTWVWVHSMRETRCRLGPKCGRRIVFAVNARTGRAMPFDCPLEILQTRMLEEKPGVWQQAAEVDLAQAHFGTCRDYEARAPRRRPRAAPAGGRRW